MQKTIEELLTEKLPQDKLMSYVGRVIHDGDTESLIRKYLKAGVIWCRADTKKQRSELRKEEIYLHCSAILC